MDDQSTAPTDGQLVGKYIEIRDQIAAMTAAFNSQLAPYKRALETIETEVHRRLNERDADSTKTEYGTAFKSTTMSVRTADKGVFMDYVKQQDRLDLLEVRPSKEGVKAFMEAHDDAVPPGIDVTFVTGVNFRKA